MGSSLSERLASCPLTLADSLIPTSCPRDTLLAGLEQTQEAMLELRNHSHPPIFQMRAWGSRLHISESVIALGVDLELLTKSSAPTLDHQGHWPSLRCFWGKDSSPSGSLGLPWFLHVSVTPPPLP